MVRANLSTRPFYNDRLVRLVLAFVTLLAVSLTIFNVVQIVRLRSRGAEVRSQADAAEQEANRLGAEARRIRQTINRDQLAAVQVAAQEANELIDRRAFSWTDLFNRFEATLPGEARIAAVTPQVGNDGRMVVSVTVVSRRVEDLDRFIEALEKTGAFQSVLSREEEAQDDGTLRSVIQGYYKVAAAPPSTSAAAVEPPPPPAAQVAPTEGDR
jgi:Tfp pilus assembly protein PilN